MVVAAPIEPLAQAAPEVIVVGVVEVAPRGAGQGVVREGGHAGGHRGQGGQGGEVVDGEVGTAAQGQVGGRGVVVGRSAHLTVVQVTVQVTVSPRPSLTSFTMA